MRRHTLRRGLNCIHFWKEKFQEDLKQHLLRFFSENITTRISSRRPLSNCRFFAYFSPPTHIGPEAQPSIVWSTFGVEHSHTFNIYGTRNHIWPAAKSTLIHMFFSLFYRSRVVVWLKIELNQHSCGQEAGNILKYFKALLFGISFSTRRTGKQTEPPKNALITWILISITAEIAHSVTQRFETNQETIYTYARLRTQLSNHVGSLNLINICINAKCWFSGQPNFTATIRFFVSPARTRSCSASGQNGYVFCSRITVKTSSCEHLQVSECWFGNGTVLESNPTQASCLRLREYV